jgi:hypothetical protein
VQRFTLPRRFGRTWLTHEDPEPVHLEDVEYALSSGQLGTFAAALRSRLGGDEAQRLTSPAEIKGGLLAFLGSALAAGSVDVSRSPGSLHTPDYWRVRLNAVTSTGRAAMDDLMDGVRSVR